MQVDGPERQGADESNLVLQDLCGRVEVEVLSSSGNGRQTPTQEEMVKYDRVTVYFKGEKEKMVVEKVSELAKSHFPGSGEPALQIIEVPSGPIEESPMGGGLFDMSLNLANPSEIDFLLLEEGGEKRTAQPEELFEDWSW